LGDYDKHSARRGLQGIMKQTIVKCTVDFPIVHSKQSDPLDLLFYLGWYALDPT
jgi:hypothetical protein